VDPSTSIGFHKLVGAGNDFIFIDLRAPSRKQLFLRLTKNVSRSRLARRLCQRQEGVGGDGVVFIEASAKSDFRWDFFNSDGSEADMCGNAARCAVRLNEKKSNTTLEFETKRGVLRGRSLSKDLVLVQLPRPKLITKRLSLVVQGKKVIGDFIDSGVPHFVVETNWSINKTPSREMAKRIQNHRVFGKSKTNVTFVSKRSSGARKTITYERGVCDFTKSCGTGALAAGFYLSAESKKKIKLKTPGGPLVVQFIEDRCLLIGSAVKVFSGFLTKEQLK
jgi:diaminopimelate epimerase